VMIRKPNCEKRLIDRNPVGTVCTEGVSSLLHMQVLNINHEINGYETNKRALKYMKIEYVHQSYTILVAKTGRKKCFLQDCKSRMPPPTNAN